MPHTARLWLATDHRRQCLLSHAWKLFLASYIRTYYQASDPAVGLAHIEWWVGDWVGYLSRRASATNYCQHIP